MTQTLFTNIGELTTNSPLGDGALGLLRDAAVLVEAGRVAWVGPAAEAPSADEVVNCAGRAVIPGFVDSHAHLVFAGDRSEEFLARVAGRPYSAGGIKTTVAATRAATDEQLRENLARLAAELHASGVTHFECKSGYGLTVEDELRALRIAGEFTDDVTLLAAHVVPTEFADDADGYVDLIINELLPKARGLARWFDVFCERGAFTEAQTRKLLTAAAAAGFELRLHANQLTESGAAALAAELGCASADHCTHLSDEDVTALAAAGVVATLLPGAEFSTRSPYPSGRRLQDAGVTVALATDCNPGSSYTTSLPFCIAVAVREMGLTVEEAVQAATLGGAAALRRDDLGRIAVGARADLVLLTAHSYAHLAYRPGVDLIDSVWQSGKLIYKNGAQRG